MKAIHSLKRVLVLGSLVLLGVFFIQPAEALAKNKGPKVKGYQKNGYPIPPGQYKKQYRSQPYYYSPGYYQPRKYYYYEGRRGYWEDRDGVRIFINLN